MGKAHSIQLSRTAAPQNLTMRSPCKKFFTIIKNITLEWQWWSLRAPALSHPHIHKPRGTVGRALHCSAAQIPAEFTPTLSNQRGKPIHVLNRVNSKDNDQPSLVHFGGFVFLMGKKSHIIVMAFLCALRNL